MNEGNTADAYEVELLKPKSLTKSAQSVKQDFANYLAAEHINKVIDEIQNPKDRMLIYFLWRSGVRITEAVSLTKDDIDFKNRIMKVKWLKSRKYNSRNVPMNKELVSTLRVYTGALNGTDKVFPFSRQRAWQIVQLYFSKGIGPHTFRHSFAVNWLRKNGDFIALHRILGHSKIQTTMEYLKIVPIDQAKELDKINFE